MRWWSRRSPLPSAATLALVAGAALVCPSFGCDAPPPRSATTTRPLDERRALEVIRRAMAAEGVRPAAGRTVELPTGKTLFVDVGVEGHGYGVAYVTVDDASKLADGIPPRNAQDERLRLVRVGEGGETRIVLLYQENYRFDDLEGEAHEQTTIACEAQLTRDVRDFLTHARTKNFP